MSAIKTSFRNQVVEDEQEVEISNESASSKRSSNSNFNLSMENEEEEVPSLDYPIHNSPMTKNRNFIILKIIAKASL